MIATEPLPAAVWDAVGLAERETFSRPPAPDRLRPAHRRRPARLRRPRRAVPLRVADRARVRPRRAGLRRAARDAGRPVPRARATSQITHAWGGPLGIAARLARLGGPRPDDRARLGRRLRRRRREHHQPGRPHAGRPRARPRTPLTRLPWVGHRSPALGARAAALARGSTPACAWRRRRTPRRPAPAGRRGSAGCWTP